MSDNVHSQVQANPWAYTSANFSPQAYESFLTWTINAGHGGKRPARERAERFRYFLENPGALPLKNNSRDRKIKSQAQKQWELRDGVIYRKDTVKRLIINEEVFGVLAREHERISHSGRDKLFNAIRTRYYGIAIEECLAIPARCRSCILNASSRVTAPLQPIAADYPFHRVQIDLMNYQEAPSGPYHWILAIRDHFSKISCLYALRSKHAEEVAFFFELWIRGYHIPIILQTDNGYEFKGALYLLLVDLGIAIKNGNPRSPQVQGLIERMNQDAKTRIAKWMHDNNSTQWHKALTQVTWSMNETVATGTGQTPFSVIFRPSMPVSQEWIPPHERQNARIISSETGEVVPLEEAFPNGVPEHVRQTLGVPDIQSGGQDGEDGEDGEDREDGEDEENRDDEENIAPLPPSPLNAARSSAPPPTGPSNAVRSSVPPSTGQSDLARSSAPPSTGQSEAVRGPLSPTSQRHNDPILAAAFSQTLKNRERIANTRKPRRITTTFETNAIVTVKVPADDRLNSDDKRCLAKVIEVYGNPPRYRLQTKHGILNNRQYTKTLMPVTGGTFNVDEDIGNNTTPITIHKLGELASRGGDFVKIRCKCRGRCAEKRRRCNCIKHSVGCSIHCHTDLDTDFDCGNRRFQDSTSISLAARQQAYTPDPSTPDPSTPTASSTPSSFYTPGTQSTPAVPLRLRTPQLQPSPHIQGSQDEDWRALEDDLQQDVQRQVGQGKGKGKADYWVDQDDNNSKDRPEERLPIPQGTGPNSTPFTHEEIMEQRTIETDEGMEQQSGDESPTPSRSLYDSDDDLYKPRNQDTRPRTTQVLQDLCEKGIIQVSRGVFEPFWWQKMQIGRRRGNPFKRTFQPTDEDDLLTRTMFQRPNRGSILAGNKPDSELMPPWLHSMVFNANNNIFPMSSSILKVMKRVGRRTSFCEFCEVLARALGAVDEGGNIVSDSPSNKAVVDAVFAFKQDRAHFREVLQHLNIPWLPCKIIVLKACWNPPCPPSTPSRIPQGPRTARTPPSTSHRPKKKIRWEDQQSPQGPPHSPRTPRRSQRPRPRPMPKWARNPVSCRQSEGDYMYD